MASPLCYAAVILVRCLFLAAILSIVLKMSSASAEPLPELYRQETRLLHLPLEHPTLRGFPVWEQKVGALREAKPAEVLDDSTPVLILHLWATWCEPCKDDFPLWRELAVRFHDQFKGRVRVFHVAMQDEASDVPQFLEKLGGKLPSGRLYFDRGGRLASNLRRASKTMSLPPLPIALWLDPERIVRQALIGPIRGRLIDISEATDRLLALVEQQEAAAQRPRLRANEE